MTNSMTTCPTAQELQGLLDQALPESEQWAMQNHVDGCEACQKVLESLVVGSESWDAAVEHLRDDSNLPAEPVLSDAVKQLKAEEFVEGAPRAKESAKPLDFLEPSEQPGSIGRLGVYEVSEVVGQGGMGVVLKAFDPVLHRVVAVKVLAPYLAHNPQARKRFVREAQAIAAVSHDHVITIHAIDESADQPKIVMQFVAGRSLQDKLDASGSLELKEILRIGMQTASGLAAAHAQGLVHRDVKPSNILLENGIQRVKLTDFGLARAVDDASMTQSGVIAGTPQYMAPEQANGDAVDYRADLFSLGSVMYAMCVGHSPFRASTTMGVLKRVCHDPPRPIQEINPDVPDWLCAIVMKLLAKSPADRFQSARQVADVLEKWLAHVQQPMVVPKPTAGEGESQHQSVHTEKSSVPTASLTVDDEIDANTIFFQPISGRVLLFLLLVGMVGAMGFVLYDQRRSHSLGGSFSVGELLLIGVLGGVITSFWGLLLIALFRFFRANFRQLARWMRGTSNSNSAANSNRTSRRGAGVINPFSFAILVIVIALMFRAGPVELLIIGLVAWKAADFHSKKAARRATRNPSESATVVNRPDEISASDEVAAFIKGFVAKMQQFARGFGNLFNVEPTEHNRLLLVMGWILAGAADLIWGLFALSFLMSHRIDPLALPVGIVALFYSLVSFATSMNIYVRQNYDWVRSASFFGLIPLSPGALVRIPLCIGTTLWLHRTEIKESFSPLSARETRVGHLLMRFYSVMRTLAATFGWLVVWGIASVVIVFMVINFYLIPYGPSVYRINDQTANLVVDQEGKLRFHMEASGSGPSTGLIPGGNAYVCDSVRLASLDGKHEIKLQLGSQVNILSQGQPRPLSEKDLGDFFQVVSNAPHSEEAASLLQTIEKIRLTQQNVQLPGAIRLNLNERIRRFSQGGGQMLLERVPEVAGYVEVQSMLDPAVFRVEKATDKLLYFDCSTAEWLLVIFRCFVVLTLPVGLVVIAGCQIRSRRKAIVLVV